MIGCDISLGSDSKTETANKRKKQHATEENYHRDDPQIGVCLECLMYDLLNPLYIMQWMEWIELN